MFLVCNNTKYCISILQIKPKKFQDTIIHNDYDVNTTVEEHSYSPLTDCFRFKRTNRITWINIDGLRKADVETSEIITKYNLLLRKIS